MHQQKSLVSQGFRRLPFAKGKHRSGMRRRGEISLLNNLYYYLFYSKIIMVIINLSVK